MTGIVCLAGIDGLDTAAVSFDAAKPMAVVADAVELAAVVADSVELAAVLADAGSDISRLVKCCLRVGS